MLHIGFSNQYFTLWDVDSHIEYNADRMPFQKVYYNYIQNLSFTESEAIKKAVSLGCTDVTVDNELCGKNSSWTRSEKLFSDFPNQKSWFFKFGKYRDLAILECTDFDYILWYYQQTGNIFAKQLLLSNGYIEHDGEVVTPEVAAMLIETASFIDQFKSGKKTTIELIPERNLTGDGLLYYNGLPIAFENYKTMYYNDFAYGLPVINGVGKKIKGKILELNVIWNSALEGLSVKSFAIK